MTTLLDALPARFTPRGPRVWAGAVLVLAGVLLIFLGGCFLVGALMLVRPDFVAPQLPPTQWTGAATFLLYACYAMAAFCLAGGGPLVFLGVRGLLRVLEEKSSES